MPHQDIDQQLQDAAVDPSLWPTALETLSTLMGAAGGNCLPVTGHVPDFPFSPSLADAADRYVREGWIFRDERARGIPKLLQAGTFVDRDIMDAGAIGRSPYYQEFLAPLKLRWFAGLGFRAGEDIWCLALQRTPEQGHFTGDEERTLLTFQGSLSRAATLAGLLGHARADGALQAFETMHRSCFLLDRQGRVIRMTEGARALIGHDVVLTDGGLRPADRARTADLAEMIAAALWADNPPDARRRASVALRRKGRRPLLAQAQALRGEARGFFGSAAVALIMTDLDARHAPHLQGLQQAFALTGTEARLLAALAATNDLRASAQACGIGYETARTYLKAIFTKTGTRSQSELSALVARAP